MVRGASRGGTDGRVSPGERRTGTVGSERAEGCAGHLRRGGVRGAAGAAAAGVGRRDGLRARVSPGDRGGAVAGSIAVAAEVALVITEGNYLLLDGGWSGVRRWLDEVWFVEGDEAVRRERLVARHVAFGRTWEEARAWVETTGRAECRANPSVPWAGGSDRGRGEDGRMKDGRMKDGRMKDEG